MISRGSEKGKWEQTLCQKPPTGTASLQQESYPNSSHSTSTWLPIDVGAVTAVFQPAQQASPACSERWAVLCPVLLPGSRTLWGGTQGFLAEKGSMRRALGHFSSRFPW